MLTDRLSEIVRILNSRDDTEHEQTYLRLLIPATSLICFALIVPPEQFVGLTESPYLPMQVAIVTSILNLALIIRHPEPSPIRRIMFMISDIVLISWAMQIAGPYGAPFFFIYVWLILGNAFRFGTPYLFATTVTAIAGFSYVSGSNAFWADLPTVRAMGYLILFIIPLYTYLLLSRLQKAQKNAETANIAKSQFLANVNHELRTPLNAIMGLTHILKTDHTLNRTQREHIQGIMISARHQLGIINNVIDMTRIETGTIECNNTPTLLHKELIDLERLFLAQATEKGLELSLEIHPDVPRCIEVDKQKLIQILTNLIGNAVKFTPYGKIVITTQYNDNNNLIVTVSDTGPGITPGDIDSIFDRFHQADNASTRQHGGSGLGLAISNEFAKVMRGKITVESRSGEGSSFTLEVPAPVSETDCIPSPDLPDCRLTTPFTSNNQDTGRLSGAHILVAEDNPVNIDVIRKILGSAGARVDIARNGQEALSCTKKTKYDLLLVDIQMPVMSGLEFMQEYKQYAPDSERAPVFVLTADAMEHISAKARELGAENFILKPFNPEMLIDNIYKTVRQTAQATNTLATPSANKSNKALLDTGFLYSMCTSLKNKNHTARLISIFETTVNTLLSELKTAIDTNDYHHGRAIIHSLISSTSSIGAICLCNLLRKLHDQPEDSWTNYAKRHHEQLHTLHSETVQALKIYIEPT